MSAVFVIGLSQFSCFTLPSQAGALRRLASARTYLFARARGFSKAEGA